MSIAEILQKYWKHSVFRPLQEEIIQSVLEGNDTLALMPTGGGKSICFQVPAMSREGICLVITPLIALMKDQVENLKSRGIEAIAIFSGMGKREVDILLDNCIYGKVKFLYLSPERVMNELVRERIRHMKINLLAVDEAHCISQWGYDFRPPYLQLAALRELHPNVPVLALTATATARVVNDIQDKLNFRNPGPGRVFRKSFYRENLHYLVAEEEDKMGRMLRLAQQVKGSGIIYVRNRRETQEVARYLIQQGIPADFYHAGLENSLRAVKQDAWKTNRCRVMVATNAFGMGIDKPDVRFVLHLDLPESLEAYYQEAGRAGRDGKPSYAVLFYQQADILRLKKNFEQSFPTLKEIKQIYFFLGNYFQLAYGAGQDLTFDFDVADFCKRYKLEPIKTLSAFKFLERDGWIYLSESVYLPSRIKFDVGEPDLYRFQVANAAYDSFIKTILRASGGAFDHFIPIREPELARRAGKSFPDAVAMLEQLQKWGVLSYLKKTDKPQLQFLLPRSDTDHLHIDRQYIEERKQIKANQLKAVLEYLPADKCRSRKLLGYFDEHSTTDCGTCDVCLANKKKQKKIDLRPLMQGELTTILTKGPEKLDKLVHRMTHGGEGDRINLIRELLDSGQLKLNDGYYYL
ncbi:ATP-dependent DNA helicase RecQ [bacterium A37T11]|nr:ATP-dependent DNA helicase RecQ [bacterium A37T11]